jgi:competence ComEA-like helix-hairpin-helix protein
MPTREKPVKRITKLAIILIVCYLVYRVLQDILNPSSLRLEQVPPPPRPRPPQSPPPAAEATEAEPRAVDLNAADREELLSLPGVGPTLAERILTQRQARGGFHHVDELLEVSGIGERLLGSLKPLVTIG